MSISVGQNTAAKWGVGCVVVALLGGLAAPAQAAWSSIFPGVDYSQWSQAGPNRISAVRVDLCAAGVELRATKSSERRQTPSAFGQSVGAEVAINADFFLYEDYSTRGLAVGDGQRWPGSTDPSGREAIAFGPGRAMISKRGHQITDYSWINDAVGGWFTVLDSNSVKSYSSSHCTTRHPRTIVGLSKNKRTLYMAVVDGRSASSVGMTCKEQGKLMKDLGAWDAISLDGGGSSAMWVRGKGVVSRPSGGSQRVVANHLAVIADGRGAPEACNNLNAAFDLTLNGAEDFYTQGDSAGIPDLLVGDEFEANILLHNTSSTVFRDVEIDYWFRDTYLTPLDYRIYSDHPAYDRQTWGLNSADEEAENPPRDQMGHSGTLRMHAFSPRETKRIKVKLRAEQYSIGHAPHPDIRGWVRQVSGLYGQQTRWGQTPTEVNLLGALMQAKMEVDVLSPHEWQFNGGEGQLEGWTACDGEAGGLGTNAAHTAMVPAGDNPARCAASPAWTAVDTAAFDQMVIRLSASGLGGPLAVGWRQADESFDAARTVRFAPDMAPEPQTYVLDLAATGAWAGTIRGLQLDWDPARFDEIAVDAIFFQSAADRKTSSATEAFVDQAPVAFADDEQPGGDAGRGDAGSSDAGSGQKDAAGSDATAADTHTGGQAGGDASGQNDAQPLSDAATMRGGCGCSAPASAPTGGLLPLAFVAIGLFGLRRRDTA